MPVSTHLGDRLRTAGRVGEEGTVPGRGMVVGTAGLLLHLGENTRLLLQYSDYVLSSLVLSSFLII